MLGLTRTGAHQGPDARKAERRGPGLAKASSIKRGSRSAFVVAVLTSLVWFPASSVLSGAAAGAATPTTSVTCTTTTSIAYGSNSIVGSIATAGADACFTFNTSPGDVVWLNMAKTSGDLSLFL